MATRIYEKYVKRGGPHEINLEWETRKELDALIANNRWKTKEQYADPIEL